MHVIWQKQQKDLYPKGDYKLELIVRHNRITIYGIMKKKQQHFIFKKYQKMLKQIKLYFRNKI